MTIIVHAGRKGLTGWIQQHLYDDQWGPCWCESHDAEPPEVIPQAQHLLILEGFSYGTPDWKLKCVHPVGAHDWRYTNEDGSLDEKANPDDCWLMSWWEDLGVELMRNMTESDPRGLRTPLPVEPSDDWDYENGGTLQLMRPVRR